MSRSKKKRTVSVANNKYMKKKRPVNGPQEWCRGCLFSPPGNWAETATK
jgi:hypothetical protein